MIARCVFIILLLASSLALARAQPQDADFRSFLNRLWTDAQAQGITRATFDRAFAGITPNPRVMAATRRQPEYGKPVGAYVNSIASAANISTGLRKEKQWHDTFGTVEKQFGVDRYLVLAIWGMETSYGADKDHWDVIRSLATLAYEQYRAPYFRNELLIALKILQEGHIARDKMVGSWAGAMGQTQFMPSNFMDYAIDFDGDRRRDIWADVPDVLASTANYFHKEGWKPDLPWGFEVFLPKDFDYRLSRGSFADWQKRGLRRADGGKFPQSGDAFLLFPTGAGGPAFLVTENFKVIKLYNDPDVYALAVGHLADRIRGGSPIRAAWPIDENAVQPSLASRIALQKKLADLGYKVHNFIGHMDFDLRDNIRDMQVKFGMRPDGHPSPQFLHRLKIPTP
ncbi:MAG TPA: lytic murein transglycosylase [Xanthobacteraceae bacterium]|nr:lytic murein transglycosylase [Xanthobacteraceae bacterium]